MSAYEKTIVVLLACLTVFLTACAGQGKDASVFDSSAKDFLLQKSLYYYPDGDNTVYKEEERHNGTMQTVSEFTRPTGDDPYSIDPIVAKYYDQNSDWQLSSEKWKKYIVPVI